MMLTPLLFFIVSVAGLALSLYLMFKWFALLRADDNDALIISLDYTDRGRGDAA